jgi:[acyl-carrier-protein] S-malonyltransferase
MTCNHVDPMEVGSVMATTAVMFPGQGSQTPGMGAQWKGHPAWSVVERAEDTLGQPLTPLLLDSRLDHTREAQLAVVLVSLMAWEAWDGPEPLAFAGHSLGQLTALIATSVLGFEDGLRLVALRADVTQDAARRRPGAMAALLGADDTQVEAALLATPDRCWLANDNAPGQVVVAGTPEGLAAATEAAKLAGVRKVMPLQVDGAFHTPLMTSARDALVEHLATVPFGDASAPIVSNGDAAPHGGGDGWRDRLADHLVQPVRWRQSLERLSAMGATDFVEVGPGTTLTGLVKRTLGVRT